MIFDAVLKEVHESVRDEVEEDRLKSYRACVARLSHLTKTDASEIAQELRNIITGGMLVTRALHDSGDLMGEPTKEDLRIILRCFERIRVFAVDLQIAAESLNIDT